jgi:quaternary ammonium compound-resistance protein SugE
MAWLFIFLASFCETLWASSLKFLNFKKIKSTFQINGFISKKFGKAFLPLITYFIFGISNMVFLTSAMKTIPLAVCYAVWMGLGLIFQSMMDIFVFKDTITKVQIGFMILILIGIVGIQLSM